MASARPGHSVNPLLHVPAPAVLIVPLLVSGCGTLLGLGDFDTSESPAGAGAAASNASSASHGGGGSGGGTVSCGNGVVDAGELCFLTPFKSFSTLGKDARGLVLVDCDADGDLDVVVTNHESGPLVALRNDGI